jgi:hypothetical protein
MYALVRKKDKKVDSFVILVENATLKVNEVRYDTIE